MSKNNHALTFPSAALFLALLFSLFLLAACEAGADSSTQPIPTAVNTVSLVMEVEDKATLIPEISATATPGVADGFDCARVNQIPFAECAALVALFNSTNGPDWVENSGWLASDKPCTWSGIDCTDDHVSQINLLYNQLTGILPPELGDLSHLRVLALWVNQLHGPLPAELGDLSELVFLDISGNQFTGPIPAELGNLTNLQNLTLAHNQLSGSIPSTLGNVASLEVLNLSHNQFSGAIPPELGNLANLSMLYLSHNKLSGDIPVSLDSLSKLYELDLSYNELRGSVPESVTRIDQRLLWGNQFEGTITANGQRPFTVDYKGIRFSADPSLATSIWPEVMPVYSVQEGDPIWYAAPEHLRFTFANLHMSLGRLRMGINLAAEAQILVYPLARLAEIDPLVQSQIEALQSLLEERGPVPAGDLPLLPVTNAAQVFHAQAQVLVYDNIQGIRFITHYAQDMRPVTSQELFYTFQGLTDDGAYYVAAFFPLTTSVLPESPESVTSEDWGEMITRFDAYVAETAATVDHLTPTEFTPDLTLLDAVVASLRVEPDGE